MSGLFLNGPVPAGTTGQAGTVHGYATACGGMLWAMTSFKRDIAAKEHLLMCPECLRSTPEDTDGWRLLDELTQPVAHV